MFKRNELIFLLALGIVIYGNNVFASNKSPENPSHLQLITIQAEETRLDTLLNAIVNQINYEIILDEELGNTVISGNYDSIPIGLFFHRALRDKNITVQYNNEDRIISVKLFGQKNFKNTTFSTVESGTQKHQSSRQKHLAMNVNNITDQRIDYIKQTENMHGMTEAELSAKLKQQNQKYQKIKIDKKDKDMSGMTNMEIWAKHKQQDVAYQNTKNSSKAIDMSGVTNSEIWAKHKQQDEEYQKTKKNLQDIGMSGMTNMEIWAKHKQQDEEYQKLFN